MQKKDSNKVLKKKKLENPESKEDFEVEDELTDFKKKIKDYNIFKLLKNSVTLKNNC